MTATVKTLHKDLKKMRRDLDLILYLLKEKQDLSEDAKKELIKARKTPDSEYIDVDDLRQNTK